MSKVKIALVTLLFAPVCLAESSYPTPEDAVRALYQALQNGNEAAVQDVLGSAKELASSGDEAIDRAEREQFVQKYQQMHRLARQSNGTRVLYIGAENWPFPIPLVSSGGAWRFDSEAGKAEVLFRRIGENEMMAVQACHTLAEREGSPAAVENAANHQTSTTEEDNDLVNMLLAQKTGASEPVTFHGYYFKILSRTGGAFSAIAYPVAYRSSGVMTFIVTQSKVVYEKDLGPAGPHTAQMLLNLRPDSTWHQADEERAN
jgi:hypothetical protein